MPPLVKLAEPYRKDFVNLELRDSKQMSRRLHVCDGVARVDALDE